MANDDKINMKSKVFTLNDLFQKNIKRGSGEK